jgi:hypothetical protein
MLQRNKFLMIIGLGALLAANVAFGKIVVENVPALFPGIDQYGMLTGSQSGAGVLKLTTNTRTHRIVIVGRAKVGNLSGRSQKFQDVGVSGLPLQILSDIYCVAKNGCAIYTAVARGYSMDV